LGVGFNDLGFRVSVSRASCEGMAYRGLGFIRV
jgi:hypothetical protein